MQTSTVHIPLLAALAALALPHAAAQAPPTYSVEQTHPSPFGGKANTINDAGLVGGSVSTADPQGVNDPAEAFLWQDGVVTWQGSFGAQAAGVAAVNENGDAVGDAPDPAAPFDGATAAFFRPAGGDLQAIPAPPLADYRQFAYSADINDAGLAAARWRVVTAATTPEFGPTYHPVVWNTFTGETTVLPTLGELYARATGITEDGELVGAAIPTNGDIVHAARWTPDGQGGYTIEDLGTIDGGTYSECNGVNDAGTCFGEATTATNGGALPAIWERGQPGRLVPMPDGATGCTAVDINENGDFVGRCEISREFYATVWIDEVPYVLDVLLDATGAGWRLTEAKGINNNGWIVGRGERAGLVDSDGRPEGFPFVLRPAGTVAAAPTPGTRTGPVLSAPAPNPTSGTARFTLTPPEAAHMTVELIDVHGRVVAVPFQGAASGPTTVTVETAGLAPGVYVLRLDTGYEVHTRRVTVVR